MNHLGGRSGRRRGCDPTVRPRLHRRWVGRALVAVALTAAALADAPAAMGNAANPTAEAMLPGSVVLNGNGTVTVTASGTWLWAYGRETDHTQGLDATAQHPCDSRTGVGWAMVWNDPDDPGYTETYTTKDRYPVLTDTVHVGSRGVDPLNTDHQVTYNNVHPCGTFVETNKPGPGDGYDTGVWTSTHVYASVADLPRAVCVITYDLGLAKPPGPHRISFQNNDNSVQWGLYNGGWNTSTMGQNCEALVTPVAAPTTTVTTTAKVVSQPTHVTPTTLAPVTRPSGTLAFTGFGGDGRLMVVLGVLLVLTGAGVYGGYRRRTELRNLVTWLIGW